MAEELKLKKAQVCMHCINLFSCKGAKDVSKCVNYIPRKENTDGNNTTDDKEN